MRHQFLAVRGALVAVAVLWALGISPAAAQLDLGSLTPGGLAGPKDSTDPVNVSARIAPAAEGRPAYLVVTADVEPGWHIYSVTQKRGGPVPSKITIEPSANYKLAGDFAPTAPPEIHAEPAFDNLTVETHEGETVWAAPLELSAGVDPASLSIGGKLTFQACDESSCLPPKSLSFTAKLGASLKVIPAPAQEPGMYEPTAHVIFHGSIEPKVVAPGQQAHLVIRAEPTDGWHIYALAARDPQIVAKPTLIVLEDTGGWKASAPEVEGHVVDKPSTVAPDEVDHYYERLVTWTIALDVPRGAQPGEVELKGLLGFQTCQDDKGCDLPQGAQFTVTVPVAAESVPGKLPLTFAPAKSYKQAADAAAASANSRSAGAGTKFDITQIHPEGPKASEQSLLLMMGFGFLGGLILNLMPCVLPVIGLKILSFVEQSGQDRRRILTLNIWYSAGILAVFLVLATLPVAYQIFQHKQFGWGQQFAYDGFNITLTSIVFVMALSFLGVWEIPIPGFVGGSTANELAAQEGFAGAFFKGALTTVLATPCSGPFLGTALAFAVAEPPHITYAVFTCIGLGMAFPYLLIGAFPRMIRFLPKPGAWMDTFKQIMGFVLLGTVVYLMTVIQWAAFVPTLALLVGLWAGCWWIGRTPSYAEFGAKARAWAGGALVAALVGVVAFQWVGPIMADRFQLAIDKEVEKQVRSIGQVSEVPRPHEMAHGKFALPWETFSIAKLQELTGQGKTVMLDFTADWCQTCQALKKFVLDTAGTQELVQTNGVVPLLVDMTRFPPEEASLLETLSGGQFLPVLAIFPAGRPNEPIVLSNGYTQALLLEKLREAGPSKDAEERTALKAAR